MLACHHRHHRNIATSTSSRSPIQQIEGQPTTDNLPAVFWLLVSTMKLSCIVPVALVVPVANAFAPVAFGASRFQTTLNAIRDKSEKSEELRFGWDGTTALGGAVVNSQPARMLEDLRNAGETIPDECEVFNANVEMGADTLMFEELTELIDIHFEDGLIEWQNGDIVNKQGENQGSANLLSYAALSNMDKETTLKVRVIMFSYLETRCNFLSTS